MNSFKAIIYKSTKKLVEKFNLIVNRVLIYKKIIIDLAKLAYETFKIF